MVAALKWDYVRPDSPRDLFSVALFQIDICCSVLIHLQDLNMLYPFEVLI